VDAAIARASAASVCSLVNATSALRGFSAGKGWSRGLSSSAKTPCATSPLTTLVESALLWWLMRRRLRAQGAAGGIHDRAVLRSAGGSLLAALIMGLCLGLFGGFVPASGWIPAIGGGFIGALVFFGLSYLFNLSETRALAAPILRRLA